MVAARALSQGIVVCFNPAALSRTLGSLCSHPWTGSRRAFCSILADPLTAAFSARQPGERQAPSRTLLGHGRPTHPPQQPHSPHASLARGLSTVGSGTAKDLKAKKAEEQQWKLLSKAAPEEMNPCNSPYHPAARHAVIQQPDGAGQLSVQDAYSPLGKCFGCGATHEDGIGLKSYRTKEGGLKSVVEFQAKHEAFPGMVSGGIVNTVIHCHGNWTAAIALMDRAVVARPPMTLTAEMQISYKQPVPPQQPVHVSSRVLKIEEADVSAGTRAAVRVQVDLTRGSGPGGELLVRGIGLFKKTGGMRIL